MTESADEKDSSGKSEFLSFTELNSLFKSAKKLEEEREKREGRSSHFHSLPPFPAPKENAKIEATVSEEDTSPEASLAAVKLRLDKMTLRHEKQRLHLRKQVASFAMKIVLLQLFIANVLFAGYLFANIQDADPGVMIAWISATVVEVIGIVFVITRSLFPNGDKKSDDAK